MYSRVSVLKKYKIKTKFIKSQVKVGSTCHTHTHIYTVNRTHTYTVSITSVFLIFIYLHSLDMLHNYCYDIQKHVLKPTIFCGLPTQEPLQISFVDEQCDLVHYVGIHRKLCKLHLT